MRLRTHSVSLSARSYRRTVVCLGLFVPTAHSQLSGNRAERERERERYDSLRFPRRCGSK